MKWYCDDCAKDASPGQPNPCPACCGWTAVDDELRGKIGDAVIALNGSPVVSILRASAELYASLDLLERVAAGEAS